MTTITIQEDIKNLPKTHFETIEEAYYAWLDVQKKSYFRSIPKTELTEKQKKDWEEIEQMDNDAFVDIR